MILFPILFFIVGIAVGILVRSPIRGEWGMYIGVAVLAGLDSICGGIRASLESKFHNDVFVSGFLANVVIAGFMAWLGDRIGINIFLVCALIFGTRIFNNLSLLRRFMLNRWQDNRAKKRIQEEQAQQGQANIASS